MPEKLWEVTSTIDSTDDVNCGIISRAHTTSVFVTDRGVHTTRIWSG